MKRTILLLSAAILSAACTKEPLPQPSSDAVFSLAETSWVGTYDDKYQGYPATLFWNLEFLSDSTGTLHLDLVIAATPQPSMDIAFRYEFNGTDGVTYDEYLTEPGHFHYDSLSHTLTWDLQVGDANDALGGTTAFHLEGQESVPFPTNTTWRAEQQLTVSDTLMPVSWRLDFWEYGLGGQVSYCAASTCVGQSFFWQYDSTAHTGSLNVNGNHYSFSYSAENELLTLNYATHIHGTMIPIGGILQFRKEENEE